VIRSCAILPRRRDWVGDGATPLMRLPDQPGILPWGTVPAVCALRVYMPTGADADCQRSPPFHGTRPPAALTSAAPTRTASARLHSTGQGPRQRSPPLRRRGLPALASIPRDKAPGSAHLRCADAGCQPPPRQNQICPQQACRDRPSFRPYAAASTRRNIARSNAPRRRNSSRTPKRLSPGGRRSMGAVAQWQPLHDSCLHVVLAQFMSNHVISRQAPYRSSLTFRSVPCHTRPPQATRSPAGSPAA
jgi:hypothetical protein